MFRHTQEVGLDERCVEVLFFCGNQFYIGCFFLFKFKRLFIASFFMEDFDMNKLNEWSDRLIEHEGIRLMPYYCPMGKLTIGVGRNLEDNPLNIEEKKALGDYMRGITENGAKMLLRNDIKRCYGALKKMILNFVELDDNRQYAMIDMCFQLGVEGFRQFKRMRRYMGKRNFVMASYECLQSNYAMQTPNRAKRIARVISTGVWK